MSLEKDLDDALKRDIYTYTPYLNKDALQGEPGKRNVLVLLPEERALLIRRILSVFEKRIG